MAVETEAHPSRTTFQLITRGPFARLWWAGLFSSLGDWVALFATLTLAAGVFSWSIADYRRRRRSDHERLRHLATRDPLTGAWNRRSLFEHGVEAVERASTGASGLSLLMLDIDYFKSINDNHGHAGGDQVLRELVVRLKEVARAFDVIGRYGGEEFAIISPRTSIQGAHALAERIRTAICEKPFSIGGTEITVTTSIGVAQFEQDAMRSKKDTPNRGLIKFEALVVAADTALYRAKDNGRNRVELAALDQSHHATLSYTEHLGSQLIN